jgi:signal transduction histidine kinase
LAAIATFLVVAVVAVGGVLLLSGDDPQERTAHAAEILRDGAGRWRDPTWQREVVADLADDRVQFVLFVGGEEIARSTGGDGTTGPASPGTPPWGGGEDDGAVRFLTIDGADPELAAQIYAPASGDGVALTVALVAILIGVAAAGVALAFGREFVRPLRATQLAAERVASGDLTVTLPRSRVAEIDRVGTAFGVMTGELRRSLEQQAAIEHERGLFIAAIAHDLRTPLFALRGHLDGLASGVAATPERRDHYLAVAAEKARTLDHLVAGLFDYTRLEYLDQAVAHEPLELGALLDELVEGMRPQAEAKGVHLIARAPTAPCAITGDRHQLARAVTNLLDNAVRYTPHGGRIEVTCGIAGDSAWFTVTDTGPGIAADDLPHLFQPLYRGDRSGGDDANGAGLGLAIAHRIVTAHHGTLTASNAPTGGAVFTATLPITVATT